MAANTMAIWPCACGCGEMTFRDGAYKKGHKNNPPGGGEFTPTDTPGPVPEGEEPVWMSLEDMAEATPDDPAPIPSSSKPATGPLRITKRIRDDVEGKLAFMLTMVGTVASMTDPVCGGAFLENADNVAAKLTPIICKSPDMVRKITKGSDIMLYVDLMVACMPIISAVMGHHMKDKRKATVNPTMPPMPADNSMYTAA